MVLDPGPEHWSQGMASGEASAAEVSTGRLPSTSRTALPRESSANGESGGHKLIAAECRETSRTCTATDGSAAGCCSYREGGNKGSDGSCNAPGGATEVATCQEASADGATRNSLPSEETSAR